MVTKSLSSTKAQNNFGRVLDDVTRNHARYIVNRRGMPEVIILSLDDFAQTLGDQQEREKLASILKDLQPTYSLGHVIDSDEQELKA